MPRRNQPLERMCIVTRQVRPVAELVRFVAAPDGRVVADLKHTLPGRGVWVSARAGEVREAARRRLFARALRAEVTAGPELADHVADQFLRAALGGLALARKAGNAVSGHAKVEAELAKGRVIALLHAAEAGEDGVRKLNAAARRLAGGGQFPAEIRAFTSEQLGLAFGAPTVVHAALLAGPAGNNALDRVADLIRFMDCDGRTSAEGAGSNSGQPQRSAGQSIG